MEKGVFSNLSPKMQTRLEKWKANILKVKSAEIFKQKFIRNYVPRRGDRGDDITDLQKPEEK